MAGGLQSQYNCTQKHHLTTRHLNVPATCHIAYVRKMAHSRGGRRCGCLVGMSWQRPHYAVAPRAKLPSCASSQERRPKKRNGNVSCQIVALASKSVHTMWPVTSPTHAEERLLRCGLLCDLFRWTLASTFLDIVYYVPSVFAETTKVNTE